MGIFEKILLIYLGVINLLGLALCGIDKRRAKRGRWRIPERRLLALSGLGGCFGFLLGMLIFRHKTRHWRFRILVPLFCVLWAGVTFWAAFYLPGMPAL